ncbi:unnamed protein product [Closterium sp. NIES-54]
MHLPDFLKRHASVDTRKMRADGVDADGNPAKAEFILHERRLEGHTTASDLQACYALAVKFATEINSELAWRMADLQNLEGTKLFLSRTYLADDDKRLAAFKKWLKQLAALFLVC